MVNSVCDVGLRNLFAKSEQSRESLIAERLTEKFERYELVSLVDMPLRERVEVCGEIRRIAVKPRSGIPAVEIEISDGTGELTVIFSGRKQIPGVGHNRALIVCGVAHTEGVRRVMLNPRYRLLPRPGQ
jgi:hypothetical protein